MNEQSSCRVVDALTTDTWSMSCEIGALKWIENVERNVYHQKCVTIYHHTYVGVDVSSVVVVDVGVGDYVIWEKNDSMSVVCSRVYMFALNTCTFLCQQTPLNSPPERQGPEPPHLGTVGCLQWREALYNKISIRSICCNMYLMRY